MDATDRRYHKRQLERMQVTARELHEGVQFERRELGDDDYDSTQDARARLDEAQRAIANAEDSLEDALNQLPDGESDDVEGYARA